MQSNINETIDQELLKTFNASKIGKDIKFFNHVLDRLKKSVSEQLDVEINDVKLYSHLCDDLGADYMDALGLVTALEEEFEIEISDEDAEKFYSVRDILMYIIRILGKCDTDIFEDRSYNEIIQDSFEEIILIVEKLSNLFDDLKIFQQEQANKLIRSVLDPETKLKMNKLSNLMIELKINQPTEVEKLIRQSMDTAHALKMMKISNLLERLSDSDLDQAVESIQQAINSTDSAKIIQISSLLQKLGVSSVDEAVNLGIAAVDENEKFQITAINAFLDSFKLKDINMAFQFAYCAILRIDQKRELTQAMSHIKFQIEQYQNSLNEQESKLSNLSHRFHNLVIKLPDCLNNID